MQTVCGTSASGCGAAGTLLRSYAYTLGPAGNRTSVAELNGRSVISTPSRENRARWGPRPYDYDDLYRLTKETVAGDPAGKNGTVTYTLDNVGNRVQRTSTLPAVAATGLLWLYFSGREPRDPNDRTSTDPYDANGNLLNGGVGTNVYDFENRLVSAGGVQIVYDGDGNRAQETAAGATTRYLTAEVNPTGYVQVLGELSGSNALQIGYLWGLQLIAQRTCATSPAAARRFF